jgi:pre-rRNA-processing protein TSR4
MDSSNSSNYKNDPVQLGFAENPRKGDFDLKNFPSKIGGLPVWLMPLSKNIPESFFTCSCGEDLSFLLQLYSPLEDKTNSFHRMLYIFFCQKCWRKKDLVKVLRINLPEESSYYNGEEILDINKIINDELTKKINEKLKKFTLDEYFISTAQEKKEASKIYLDFYSNAEEKSINSSDSSYNKQDIEEDEIVFNNVKEEKEYDNMVQNYLKENPGENINKVEEESDDEKENDKMIDSSNNDIILNIFTRVTNYDKKQIIRFYRNNFYPLWFTQEKMLTTKNTKCTNCGGDVVFEFQIMPYLFLIEPKIAFNDIGTIVIYTCKNCCDSKIEGGFVEEHGFIQRTGENFRDFNDNDNKYMKDKKEKDEAKEIKEENEFFAGVDEKDIDEEGFAEVKKKKPKKHHKKNKKNENEENSDEDKKDE